MAKRKNSLVLACSQQVEGVPEIIRLLPLGQVKSQKGNFVVDEESYRAMCRSFAAHDNDLVIDYEHQTLSGEQAPAGGWIKELILTEDAICGRVEWTDKAAAYLKSKEYRYLSPVVLVRRSDRKALELKSAALTNTPAVDSMFPIINALDFNDEGEDDMELLAQIAALLGLPEGATEDEVTAAVKQLAQDAAAAKEAGELVANKAILSLLSLKEDAKTPEVAAKIAALQNPANFVPVEQYNLIANKLQAREGAGLVELALTQGKITPAQKAWAEQYAAQDTEGFKSFLSLAIPVVPMERLTLSTQTGGKPDTEADAMVRRQLGISDESAKKFGKDDF